MQIQAVQEQPFDTNPSWRCWANAHAKPILILRDKRVQNLISEGSDTYLHPHVRHRFFYFLQQPNFSAMASTKSVITVYKAILPAHF